jgi:hypothetical protein
MAWHAELWLCWVYPQLDYDYTYMMYTYAVWRWWGGNCICDCILEFTMVCYHIYIYYIYIYLYMCIYDYIIYIIICTYTASPIAHFIALGILVPRRSPLLQRGGWPWGCQLSSPVEGGHVPHLGGATKGAVHCCSWAAQDSALGRWRGWCVYTYIIIIVVVIIIYIYVCVCLCVYVYVYAQTTFCGCVSLCIYAPWRTMGGFKILPYLEGNPTRQIKVDVSRNRWLRDVCTHIPGSLGWFFVLAHLKIPRIKRQGGHLVESAGYYSGVLRSGSISVHIASGKR